MAARSVLVIGYPDAELLDIACVTSTLAVTDLHGVDPPYAVTLLSRGGAPLTCRPGLVLEAHAAVERWTEPADTIVVTGGLGHEQAAADPLLVAHVARLARQARRVTAVCTGASVLAAAGLLDGRRATTHWFFAERLARAHPAVRVDPDPVFVRDGPVATSAGVTAALDLTLSLVEEDHGARVARRVARSLVTYLQRPGSQAQMSVHVTAPAPAHGVVRTVVEHVAGALDQDLSTPVLAALAGVSERHLARLFHAHTGRSPAAHVRRTRTEAAAGLLATTDVPLARVAARCGFGSTETLRHAFHEVYGEAPAPWRARARAGRR